MAGRYARMLRDISREVCAEYQSGEKDALKRVLRRHNLAVIQTMFISDFMHLQKFKQLLVIKNRMLPSMISSPPALSDPEELKSIQEIAIKLNKILNEDVDELLDKIKTLGSYQYVLEKMGWNNMQKEEEIKEALEEIKGEEKTAEPKDEPDKATEGLEGNTETNEGENEKKEGSGDIEIV